jgi:CelD/BcsL family acetyltransferase involved in cellulose biosynthesis
MTGPFTSSVITDEPALAALAPDWWELWRQSPNATPFQSPAWLLPWWRNLARGELRVLALRLDGRLVGLAPFCCEQDERGRLARLMGFPVTDYQDFLVAPGLEQPVLALLSSHLSHADFWDILELAELPPGALALRMAAPASCSGSAARSGACPVLGLPDTADELMRAMPARKRRALSCARHRADRRGGIHVAAADANSVLEGFETLVALHRHRWSTRGEPGVLADPHVQQFHREAMPHLMRAGLLRLYVLHIDRRPAAAYYGFVHRNQAYGYLTGFDPAFTFESPGVILFGHVALEAINEGVRMFHFLRGRESYKYGWGARDSWNEYRAFQRVGIGDDAAKQS